MTQLHELLKGNSFTLLWRIGLRLRTQQKQDFLLPKQIWYTRSYWNM